MYLIMRNSVIIVALCKSLEEAQKYLENHYNTTGEKLGFRTA